MITQMSTDRPQPFNIDRFKNLYNSFTTETVKQLPNLYSGAIIFKDPIHQLQGLTQLSQYFSNFCTSDTHCTFQFNNQIVAHDQAFFQWTMRYRNPNLNSGQDLSLNGATLIRFNSHIIYHEDFYDMGAMIYQHIPVLGWLVKKINARIAGEK